VKKSAAILILILLLFPNFVSAKNLSPKDSSAGVVEQFKKSFPKNNFESVTPTDIKGLYEVYTGNQIYYYMPKDDVIIGGPVTTKNGVNVTKESYSQKMAQKMAKLPLDGALKIGNGKTAVVEFIDPNFHLCRESYKYFTQRKDVTIYAFFFPLSKESADKTKHILCSKDPAKAYEDALGGKLNNAQLAACADKKVDETIKTHMKSASQIGVRGTPLFYIKGQIVEGFDQPLIEKLLKD
jgi:thiol:disulfide interchange protein DsbC